MAHRRNPDIKETDLSKNFPEIKIFGNLWRLPGELLHATVGKFDSWTKSMTEGYVDRINRWNNADGKTWSEYKKDKPFKSMFLGNMQESVASSYKTFQKKWYLAGASYVTSTLAGAYAGGLAAMHGALPTLGQMTSLPAMGGNGFLGFVASGLKFAGGMMAGGYTGLLGAIAVGFAGTAVAAATASATKSVFFNSIVTWRRNNYLKGIEKANTATQTMTPAPVSGGVTQTSVGSTFNQKSGVTPSVAAPASVTSGVVPKHPDLN